MEGTFWEHILSLRNHLIAGGVFFIAITILSFAYATDTLIGYLLEPLHGQTLVFLSPLGPFLFKMKISFLAGCVASVPVWLGLVAHFAWPAIPHTRRLTLVLFVLGAALLAALSVAVTYAYLVPTTLAFLLGITVPGTSVFLTADSYASFFLLEFIVAFVILQLPLAINIFSYVGFMNPHALARQRRLLYPALLVVLAILTPTTDAVTLAIISIPAFALVEIGLAIAKWTYDNR